MPLYALLEHELVGCPPTKAIFVALRYFGILAPIPIPLEVVIRVASEMVFPVTEALNS